MKPGDVVRATVKYVATFGLFLEVGGADILVLIPYTSWIPCFASCHEFAAIGDEFDVKITKWAEDRHCYVGSIRDAHPHSDPWSGPWNLRVGDAHRATVVRAVERADKCGGNGGYLLELRPAAYVMLCGAGDVALNAGQPCDVVVTAVTPGREVRIKLRNTSSPYPQIDLNDP